MAKGKTRINNNIRALRLKNGEMTQADLATRVGVTRQTINAIERDKYSPSLEVAFLIAEEFGIGIDKVFGFAPKT